jgi:hypothetical protein
MELPLEMQQSLKRWANLACAALSLEALLRERMAAWGIRSREHYLYHRDEFLAVIRSAMEDGGPKWMDANDLAISVSAMHT